MTVLGEDRGRNKSAFILIADISANFGLGVNVGRSRHREGRFNSENSNEPKIYVSVDPNLCH